MSRILATILFVFMVMGLGVAGGERVTSGGAEFQELHRVDVVDTEELQVVMGLIERSSESRGAKHYHPGPELGYILEGALTFETENARPVTLVAGDTFFQPAKEWHIASTAADGVKSVVFRLLRKGEPMIVKVD